MSRTTDLLDSLDSDWRTRFRSEDGPDEDLAVEFYREELAEMQKPPSRVLGLGHPFEEPTIIPGRREDWEMDDER